MFWGCLQAETIRSIWAPNVAGSIDLTQPILTGLQPWSHDQVGRRGRHQDGSRGYGDNPMGVRHETHRPALRASDRLAQATTLTFLAFKTDVNSRTVIHPERVGLPFVRAAALGRRSRPSGRPTGTEAWRTAESPAHHPPGERRCAGPGRPVAGVCSHRNRPESLGSTWTDIRRVAAASFRLLRQHLGVHGRLRYEP